jgi:Tol biopolymer transport system component
MESDKLLLFDRASAKLSDITPANLTHPSVLGWRADGALILQTADPNYTVVTLWAEDIKTKAARQITKIPSTPENANFKITIAPNGAACVLYTSRHQDNPFTPLVETIDLTTGAIHPLPNITKTTGANFDNLIAAWRPDGSQLALERGGNPVNSVWILDLAHDTVAHATDGVHPVGWAPDGSGLVLSTVEISSQYAPHELAVLPLPVTAPGTLTTLTDHAVMFPFLGFVRGG